MMNFNNQRYCGPEMIAVSSVVGKIKEKGRELLKSKGCKVMPGKGETDIVTYPEGTKRREIFPRTVQPRYLIILPNGSMLREETPIGKDYVSLFVDTPEDKAFLGNE